MTTSKTEILLAAYNGERYLEEQILSILDQDCDEWFLTVSDDGSGDSTKEILDRYVKEYPDRIRRIESGRQFRDAKEHFFFLLEKSTGDSVMFCDQDDIWEKDKVSSSRKLLRDDIPCLVCSDLKVVGEDLSLIDPSFFRYQGIREEDFKLSCLLYRNSVTGCTCLLNRKLVDLLLQIKDRRHMIMHDYAAALLAGIFGEIIVNKKAEVLYRQHGDNALGAQKKGFSYLRNKMTSARSSVKAKKAQVRELIRSFGLDEELLKDFAKEKSGASYYLSHREDIASYPLLFGFLLYG